MIETDDLNRLTTSNQAPIARLLTVTGRVQGVGFRPFVYRLATDCKLNGWVKNARGTVYIHLEGLPSDIDRFCRDLIDHKPAISQPSLASSQKTTLSGIESFEIRESSDEGESQVSVPTDLFLCDDCLGELNDPANRRYQYPFINCTQCGPRFTIIQFLPYDRSSTTMSRFVLCDDCAAEYSDPANRRFHAEPVACSVCGPHLSFKDSFVQVEDNQKAIKLAAQAILQGKIIAIKGIGGYHLVCDATREDAVCTLRNRKHRPHKPFAVMFPAPLDNPLSDINRFLQLDARQSDFLQSASRPIVLLPEKTPGLASNIAPGLNEIGAMLPYSPLHHLLLNQLERPIVATSANISGEPVLTDNQEVETRLSSVADAFLHHNRDIHRPADDSVFRIIHNQPRPVRYGRGVTPLEVELPFELEQPVIAVGAHMKDTICLAWSNRLVMSSHIGEMHMARSLNVFEQTLNDLQHLYGVTASQFICDAHPGYTTHQWARKQPCEVHTVYHHHAHASACYFEANTTEDMLVFTWDGTGYADDGSLWGAEAFLGRPGQWVRTATIRSFDLPGGDKVALQPWRSALSIARQVKADYSSGQADEAILKQALDKKLNCSQSSSMGRLFDAASVLCGLPNQCSFDGQAPMQLEALCGEPVQGVKAVDCSLTQQDTLWVSDWSQLVAYLLASESPDHKARVFHESIAQLLLQQANAIRKDTRINLIGLSGGVFQNRYLTERVITLLEGDGFEVCYPSLIPVNDAGISFGQVIEYAYK